MYGRNLPFDVAIIRVFVSTSPTEELVSGFVLSFGFHEIGIYFFLQGRLGVSYLVGPACVRYTILYSVDIIT